MSTGAQLALVATPIGNLGDLSPRAAQALRDADAIACEDTRHTRKLLAAQGITGKRLLAVHEHNERSAADGLVALALEGQTIALVSDAGTPGISDPGAVIVAAFVAAGIAVTCIPGPAALVVALAISGLPTERFVFEGFLDSKGSARRGVLAQLAVEPRTIVLYEAPHRLLRTLADLTTSLGGDRRVCVCRELTKRFEESWHGTLAESLSHFETNEPRGEFVIVVAGALVLAPDLGDAEIERLLGEQRSQGLRTSEAVDAVCAHTGLPRKRVYTLALGRPS